MRKVLFLGNGINRASAEPSWSNLVGSIARQIPEIEKDSQSSYGNKESLTLSMEALFSIGKRNNMSEYQIRRIVSSYFDGERSPIFDALREKEDIRDIITTNYDRNIENHLAKGKKNIKKEVYKNEQKYNLYRKNVVHGRNIWHIHGDATHPSSIQMGFEHYAGQLSKIKSFRDDFYRTNGSTEERIKRPVNYRAWVEPFLWDDVHIIGFGLSNDEIDVWWVLQYWARKKDQLGFGPITFYSTDDPEDGKIKDRNEMLSFFGVEVYQSAASEFKETYETLFAKWIRQ